MLPLSRAARCHRSPELQCWWAQWAGSLPRLRTKTSRHLRNESLSLCLQALCIRGQIEHAIHMLPHLDLFCLKLMSFVQVSIAIVLVLAVANRVLNKMATVPMGEYLFFLAQIQTFGYVLFYGAILYSRVRYVSLCPQTLKETTLDGSWATCLIMQFYNLQIWASQPENAGSSWQSKVRSSRFPWGHSPSCIDDLCLQVTRYCPRGRLNVCQYAMTGSSVCFWPAKLSEPHDSLTRCRGRPASIKSDHFAMASNSGTAYLPASLALLEPSLFVILMHA